MKAPIVIAPSRTPAVSWYNVDRNVRRRILKGLGIDTRQAAAE